MILEIRYQKKINADVYTCPDCGANQFALVANDSSFYDSGEVVCVPCNESFGSALRVLVEN